MRGARLAAYLVALLACSAVAHAALGGQALPRFIFTDPNAAAEWAPTHDIGAIQPSPDGMQIAIRGPDPYTTGPARDYPVGVPLWLELRLLSDQGGTLQVFYYPEGSGPTEERSVRFPVKPKAWVDAKMPMPALGPRYHLRIDPPGDRGTCTVASIRFETRVLPKAPAWPRPPVPAIRQPHRLHSGDILLTQDGRTLGAFTVAVAGQPMACGNTRPLIGYEADGKLRWVDVARVAHVRASPQGAWLQVTATFADPDGGRWTITQAFGPAPAGTVAVETRVAVSQDRWVSYLPVVSLLPGVGSFGRARNQGLFAGLEYMDAPDVSSSQADIEGPGSRRQVPDTERITFPLMAVQAKGRYVGLAWEAGPDYAAVFDSPDRQFGSGGHLMGVLFPGCDGTNREEGQLLPYRPELLSARKPLVLRATILGGRGESIVPAVKQYVALRGLPPLPSAGPNGSDYLGLAAGGWLDSRIRDDGRYRHAWWPGASFGPGPAADAAVWMLWLAARTGGATLAGRLRQQAQETIALVPPGDLNSAGVSHVRYPVPSLIYGHVEQNVQQAVASARATLSRFRPDGTVTYEPRQGQRDFGRTHFARHANGLTAPLVGTVLEAASLSGDRALLREGLRLLRAMGRYRNTVPRGAQTWEVPLHTPDILASAHLVRDYVLGYELSGDRRLLDQAVYWAWTGVPFVYLVNPTGQSVGLYATIPVFGATYWTAVNWMGLPVQWCGLVYSDALYRLARYDRSGPWRKLADGITVSGIQQSWPRTDHDLQGLLPDSFNLRAQSRNPVAINPGTVQANVIAMNGPAVYDFHAFRGSHAWVHAPGAIEAVADTATRATFRVRGWSSSPYYLLVAGLGRRPVVRVNGRPVVLTGANTWHADGGRVILKVAGNPTVEIGAR